MNKLMNIGNKVVIKYNGDKVRFGQCYDGMIGKIGGRLGDNYQIILDEKSTRKITELNYRNKDGWSIQPLIPFKYVEAYNKTLEIE